MREKKVIILDLTDCISLSEVHERIRISFGFPEWYGANWDAFWDLLSRECDADEVVIKGVGTVNNELADYINILYNLLDKNVSKRKEYSTLYNHINPFSYRTEN